MVIQQSSSLDCVGLLNLRLLFLNSCCAYIVVLVMFPDVGVFDLKVSAVFELKEE